MMHQLWIYYTKFKRQMSGLLGFTEVNNILSNKASMFEALVRNQVVLPKKAWCSYEFLLKTFSGEIYKLLSTEVQYRLCFDAPSKEDIYSAIVRVRAAKQGQLPLDYDHTNLPDAPYLLLVLSSLDP